MLTFGCHYIHDTATDERNTEKETWGTTELSTPNAPVYQRCICERENPLWQT